MARDVIRAMSRVLRPAAPDTEVHFHAGDGGMPVVCEHPRCTRPHLDLAETGFA